MTRHPQKTGPRRRRSGRPADGPPEAASPMRLQRFLAQAGLGSRRACEELAVSGRIAVDGEQILEIGVNVDPARQQIFLDGERIWLEPKRYFLLNKPPGYLCTHRDPAGRPRAVDLVPQDGPSSPQPSGCAGRFRAGPQGHRRGLVPGLSAPGDCSRSGGWMKTAAGCCS